jgi:osmotically-inducible protein OsmY/uncharacterized protein (DUF2267 family)
MDDYSDDLRLTQDIRDELAEALKGAADVVVTVRDGAITLSGSVRSYVERVVAEETAARTAGVRAVVNELTVSVPDVQRRDDPVLAEAVAHALRWHAAVPAGVRASVRDGWVTLEGKVSRYHERLAAERAVSVLIGVSGITNDIEVQPQPVAANIRTDIERALGRSALLAERHIGVHVDDSHVTLRGVVRSWVERSEAERLAWMAGGVTAIDNQLTIGLAAQTEEWGPVFDRIEGSGVLPPDVGAGDAARAVLCALSLRMSREDAQLLAAVLPGELNRLVHPCVRHRRDAPDAFDRTEFLRRVADHLLVSPEQAEFVARAVFAALKNRVPAAEIQDIATQLPSELKELWQTAA